VVLGSNGESTFLSVEERVEMVRSVRQLSAHDRLVIAGAGCECKLHDCTVSVYMIKVKVKASHTRYRALGPELIPVYRQSACR